MSIKKLILPLVGLFFLSIYLFPGIKGGIKGKIVNKDNQPIEAANVTIISVDYPAEQYTLKANKKGEFIQIGLEPGFYRIRCEKEGFQTVEDQVKVNISEIFEKIITLNALTQQVQEVEEAPGKKELREANKLFQEGKYVEALKAYEEAVAKNPSDAIAYYNLGVAYMALARTDEAIEAFKKTVELQPDNSAAFKNLGQIYGKMKNFEESSKYYAQAVKLSAGDPEAFYNLGVSLINLGNQTGAMEAFQKSIACNENYADSYYQLGLIYLNQNRMDEALAAFEKFLQIGPDDPKALNVKKMIEIIKKQKSCTSTSLWVMAIHD